ncbi:MAG: GNAT family N-acetyltransferase [Symbiobacterium sp.]|uniref:GNAT family N-acetyltransferase n=1 Tax=Symbiobacterium sp. TaxID=1971213 RepID=UPI003464D8FD
MAHPHAHVAQVRKMTAADLPAVDHVFRLSLGTFNGLEDPLSFSGDAAVVRCRHQLYPEWALVAEAEGRVVGSNFISRWGSLGLFGPLTVHPSLWNRGIGRALLDETMARFAEMGVTQRGIFTFARDTKHITLYGRYGYYPQYLHLVMGRTLPPAGVGGPVATYGGLAAAERAGVLAEALRLTDLLLPGLDLTREIEVVDAQGWGDTVLLLDGDRLRGFAVCHAGAGTEAGSDTLYVKFGAARDDRSFAALIDACEGLAAARGMGQVLTGVNMAREPVYRALLNRGYRALIPGLCMQSPNCPGYNRPDAFVIDDWR